MTAHIYASEVLVPPVMKKVHFHGKFAEMAGVDSYSFAVTNPIELLACLNSQVKGFREYTGKNPIIMASTNDDMSVIETVKQNEFELSFGELDNIHVAPAVGGSGIETAIAALGYGAFATAVIVVAANIAISFVVSAIIKALAPSPDSSDGAAEADKRPSFLYNGAKLVSEQGYAIPLIYGTHMSGGILIFTDLVIEDIPFVAAQAPFTPGADPGFVFESRGADLPTESYQWGQGDGA